MIDVNPKIGTRAHQAIRIRWCETVLGNKPIHEVHGRGFDRDFEAYALSAQHPAYADLLRASGIDTVAVCGIATNICCFFVARDLRKAGFRVLIIEDASAGIDVPAAGLFQAKAKEEGTRMDIEYARAEDFALS